MLVSQVQGAVFTSPPQSYLYGLDEGYARPTQEQVSRGTIKNPLEDSWTCLQRLHVGIDFRCFEYNGSVYFGPDSWLTTLAGCRDGGRANRRHPDSRRDIRRPASPSVM